MAAMLERLKVALVNERALAAVIFLAFDTILTCFIVAKVPYTEIDWIAYMQEIEGVMRGEYDYSKLRGQTGPLVYPGGFVWVFAGFRELTNDGKDIAAAQRLFVLIYILTQAVVMRIYVKTKLVPAWALCLLVLSKRIHSIYVLRMFNDGVAMLFFFVSLLLFVHRRWGWGCVAYSLAVSVKMNILLYAPGLLYLLLCSQGLRKTAALIVLCACVQLMVGVPFLLSHPGSYIRASFDFSRVFLHRWSVNLKFLPEEVFVSKSLALSLLAAHLGLLYVWYRRHLKEIARTRIKLTSGSDDLDPTFVCKVLMTANFIGVVCARTLHFQFYAWYFHSLPALLWCCDSLQGQRGLVLKITLWMVVEICFNVTLKDGCKQQPVGPDCGSPYPEGAMALTGSHAVMMLSLLAASPWKLTKSTHRE